MPVVVDPLASLTTWPIEFFLGGRQYTIPAMPAADWLVAILDELGSFEAVVELLPVSDKAELEQAIIDGKVAEQAKEETFRDAVEAVAGRPWWVVINYGNLLRTFWGRFHGRLLLSGLDPQRVSLGAYLDAFYASLIEGRDEQARQKIDNYLETPPMGMEIELDEESESDTFLAMMNQAR